VPRCAAAAARAAAESRGREAQRRWWRMPALKLYGKSVIDDK
jgi:hypothetical protein